MPILNSDGSISDSFKPESGTPTSKLSKAPATPKAKSTKQRKTTDTPDSAITQTVSTKKLTYQGVKSYIERTNEVREADLEQASEIIAFLHDPVAFENEVFARAARKIENRTVGRNSAFESELLADNEPSFDDWFDGIHAHGCLQALGAVAGIPMISGQ